MPAPMTIEKMAEAYASAWEKGDPYFNVSHNAYLAGAKAALEMAQHTLPPTNQRFSGYDIRQRIRALLPKET